MEFLLHSSRQIVQGIRHNNKTKIVIVVTLLFLLTSSFLLAWPCRSPDTFIGHADEANLANLAQNIANGKGAVVDTAWLYTNGGIPGEKLPQPEPYWSVYAAALVAPFFRLFGETRLSLILVPLILRAVITFVCVAVVYSIDRRRITPALSIGAILCFSPILNGSINGLSDIYLATATLVSIVLMAVGIVQRSSAILFYAGAMAGFGVGLKPSGVIAFFAFPFLVLAVSKLFAPEKRIRSSLLYLAGGLIGVSVYFSYNMMNFGSLAAPGYKIVDQEATTIFRSLYKADMAGRSTMNDGKPIEIAGASMKDMDFILFAQHNPEASVASLPPQVKDPQEKLKRPFHNLSTFLSSASQGKLLPLWLFPFIAAGIFALGCNLRKRGWHHQSQSEWLLLISLTILVGGLALALRIYFAPRYWLPCMPILLILAFYGLKKTTINPTFYSLALLLLTVPWSGDWFRHYKKYECQAQTPAYRKLAAMVPQEAIVMTTNPWQLSFHTRRRSVVTPYTTDQRIIRQLAERYGVSYLAVVKSDTSQEYPRFRRLLDQDKLPLFNRIYDDKDLSLYTLSLKPE
jgi:hypothetical protein